MSDGFGGAVKSVAETVVRPVTDEVGKALEQGAQSVVGGPGAGQVVDQSFKQSQEENKLNETRRKLKYWKDLEEAQKRVRDEQKQKEMAKQKEEQDIKQVKQFEIVKKQEVNATLQQAQRRTEVRKGVGG